MSSHPDIYRKGVCWYGKRQLRNEKPTDEVCGIVTAGLFKITKKLSNAAEGPFAIMWLCDRHTKVMEKKGYICTRIQGIELLK